MAWMGKWGTFLHRPKSGGQFIRALIKACWPCVENGPYHGFPEIWDWNMPIFTTTRHPAFWLRSLWAHQMRNNWKVGGTESPIWNDLTNLIEPYGSDNFEVFVENLYPEMEGVVTWFQGIYAVPGVQRVRLGCLKADLARIIPETEKIYDRVYDTHPRNRSEVLPEMTDELRNKIEYYEAEYFDRYGLQFYA